MECVDCGSAAPHNFACSPAPIPPAAGRHSRPEAKSSQSVPQPPHAGRGTAKKRVDPLKFSGAMAGLPPRSRAACSVPGLVLPGDDTPHPAVTGRELAEILPDVETLHDRKGPAHLDEQRHRVLASLGKHTPPEIATGRALRSFAKKGRHPTLTGLDASFRICPVIAAGVSNPYRPCRPCPPCHREDRLRPLSSPAAQPPSPRS
jgi:hypothetical protein